MKKFNFDVYSSEIDDYKDYEFEIQVMDNFIFNDTLTKNKEDLRELSSIILKEMVVSPADAGKLKFWRQDFDGLQEFLTRLIDYQNSFMTRSKKRKGFREIKQS